MSKCEGFIENKNIHSSAEMQDNLGGVDFSSGLIFVCSLLFRL